MNYLITTVEYEIIEYPHFTVEKEKKKDEKNPLFKITWDNHSNNPKLPYIRVLWDNENPSKVKVEIDGEEKDLSNIHKL